VVGIVSSLVLLLEVEVLNSNNREIGQEPTAPQRSTRREHSVASRWRGRSNIPQSSDAQRTHLLPTADIGVLLRISFRTRTRLDERDLRATAITA
jgi:hypothetical protein